ncbi:MAG: relaxase/mobilization nuclease domain-containing protein [Gemmatimonadota bacterium]|nr:relaxase/mobilization nuclease domain-containing protein [Gemmatimonadota bacterium]
MAWSSSRNLPTDDPELGAKIMRATAAQNVRVDKPVYHLALSFDPNDTVDRAAMERVADRVLAALRLQEHQVVIVAHKDREHAHVHLLVNRVHPETGRVWSRWQDQRMVQQALREEERALGIRQVPGRLTREAARHEMTPASVPVHAPNADTRPSDPATRARNSYETVDELASDLRTYERVAELTQRQYTARLDADAARARTAQLSSAFDRARAAEEAFIRALGEVYRTPAKARDAYVAIVTEQGIEAAVRTLRAAPERLGALLEVERRRALGLAAEMDDRPARAAAGQAAHLGQEAASAERALSSMAAEVRVRRLNEIGTLGPGAARGTVAIVDGVVGWDAAGAAREAASERKASEQHANQATEQERALSRELRGAPRLPELRDQIARTADRLLPHELRRLRTMVSAPQMALLTALRATVRDALLAREAERNA